jgi:hypothetical protein
MIETVGAFASMVGLMADFAASRGHRDVVDIREFTEWLRTQGHFEVVSLLESNKAVSVSIKAMLKEGLDTVTTRIDTLERAMAQSAPKGDALRSLGAALRAEIALSDQGLAILRAYVVSKAGKALMYRSFDGAALIFIDGERNKNFEPVDAQFFEADLEQLCDLGYLLKSANGKGQPLFQLTRAGAALVAPAQ